MRKKCLDHQQHTAKNQIYNRQLTSFLRCANYKENNHNAYRKNQHKEVSKGAIPESSSTTTISCQNLFN